jgi:hypothetical protein
MAIFRDFRSRRCAQKEYLQSSGNFSEGGSGSPKARKCGSRALGGWHVEKSYAGAVADVLQAIGIHPPARFFVNELAGVERR